MKFLIITHVPHKLQNKQWFAYAPYVNEMNLWLKYVDEIEILAPKSEENLETIDTNYIHKHIKFTRIPAIAFISVKTTILSFFRIPFILLNIIVACNRADHIHLRCPGNIGLLGCFVQVFFPKKIKTAKYAGNWDSNSKQPLSYRIQKRLLSNVFWTRNIKVLVYGSWKNQSKNIVPFFTATYSKKEIEYNVESNLRSVRFKKKEEVLKDVRHSSFNRSVKKFLFVGTLTVGKRPILSVQVIHKLIKNGHNVHLDIYGEGEERIIIEDYIKTNALSDNIILHGNVSKCIIKQAFKTSDFLLFISKSEGWPKVVAEAMFWGCLPIASNVSCIPDMLDKGNRGAIVSSKKEDIVSTVERYLTNHEKYKMQVERAILWSRQFTIEKFENEISKFVKR
ncbi:glycosyltransferase family 4 protein [Thalassobellus citreus]|uniref:glycosyltransferase family 4 protein n=1 Tax=Thalassobellus citreus TaxID=3367752 RepID=UPI00378C0FE5